MTPEANTTGFYVLIERSDPDGTYCCHPSPKQLRDWTREYNARERGFSIVDHTMSEEEDAELHQRLLQATLAKFPSLLIEESDEERPTLDCDDSWVREAWVRFETLQKRAAAVKHRAARKIQTEIDALPEWPVNADCKCSTCKRRRFEILCIRTKHGMQAEERLTTLRQEWKVVEDETGVSFEEVQAYAVETGRDGDARIKRERAEVAYCYRDPSDWQVRAEWKPERIEQSVAKAKAHFEREAEWGGPEFTNEERERIVNIAMIRDRRRRIAVAWRRLFAELGQDADHGRIILTWHREWVARNGNTPGRWKYLAPKKTIGRDEFVARKIREAGDELDGLNKALNSLRYRIEKQRERNERRVAA